VVLASGTVVAEPKKTSWDERFTVRGYLQVRFNRAFTTEPRFENELADQAIAADNRFSIRRARFVLSGTVTDRVLLYAQAEFAGADAKMRDWYGDIAIDAAHELRVRVGQSKVPYGFENMQSSQNRGPLDRSDPINTAVPGERDLGASIMWAPEEIRARFKHLADDGLKGSGDYGVLALGAFNGQLVNLQEQNENLHVYARASYPFAIRGQIIEGGVQAYTGKFTVVDVDDGVTGGTDVRDARVAASLVWYPQPIGFSAEYNVGVGPELDPATMTIASRSLQGGYAMVMARFETCVGDFVPFVRGAIYEGGIKNQPNAPRAESRELLVGTEWQFHGFEVVGEVDHAKRTVGDSTVWGTIVRFQVQINY